MQTYIVARNVCNLYAPGSDTEIVSQAILGETVCKTGASAGHIHVHTADRYQGRIRAHALIEQSDVQSNAHERAAQKQRKQVKTLFAPVLSDSRCGAELITTLVLSTVLTVNGYVHSYARILLPDGSAGFIPKRHLGHPVKARKRSTLATIGSAGRQAAGNGCRLVGTPYLWGGSTPYGIDCSGFTQLCYRLAGVTLLRDARLQFADNRFEPVAGGHSFEQAKLQSGDLVFFGEAASGSSPERITHVGIILPDGRMIHSAGGFGVVIESRSGHRYAGKYLGARRLKPGSKLDIKFA
jgi:cell wall-associated NlpC family hydrolase